jgi:hypothetical protein
MRRKVPVLSTALLALLLCLAAHGQDKPSAAIPATAPTQSVSDLPSAHPALTASAAEAGVTWTGSVLTIQGKGDSLRNILVAVSRATGMKITGGVPEEQVFGSYGPGAVQDVLPQLFDGIGVNVLLMNDGAKPKELVLTARTGGVTPPQTRPIADADQGFRNRLNSLGRGQGNGNQPPPIQAQPPQPSRPQQTGAVDASTPATPATNADGQPQSPNGVRTPEQIFEELRQRQQQQQQQPR